MCSLAATNKWPKRNECGMMGYTHDSVSVNTRIIMVTYDVMIAGSASCKHPDLVQTLEESKEAE